ncbi:MAG TPA: type VI secretion IcmF C-terminal domain-containing protein, partial [Burkholderiaceae bacterium]|nr:type VI secretion IcmF C-terminal domain-containing protein [Burkholderiaceae bacterium]
YRQWLRKYSTDVLHQFASESTWVLGTKTPVVTDPTTEARVLNEVEQFYLADYGRVWEGLLEDIRVAPTANLAQTAEVAQGLARPDSPLVTLLNAVVREVSLTPAATGGDGAPRTGAEALQALDGKFAPLREFAANRTGLQETQELLGKLATHLAMVDDAVKRKTPAPASDIARDLAAQAARTPPPVRGMLTQLAAIGSTELFAATREQLGRQFASEVGAVCKRIEGRYPLARASSDDISREEFSRTFATGGLIDGFFQRHLAPYVDVSTRPWTFVRLGAAETQGAQATKTEHADALLPFQRAQSIRDAFFRDGGRALGVRLEFRLLEMDAGVSAFALEVDGQNMRFTRDLKQAQSVQWPGPGSTGRVHLRVASGTRGEGSGYVFEGPWALFRMIERVRVEPGASLDRVQLLMDVEGRRARFEVRSATPINPIRLLIQEQFQCPQRL